MRVRVDPDLCEGYGLCVQLLPTVFEMGEELPVKILADTVDPALRAKLADAVAQCPRAALSLEE
jgi:ferredoxin